MHAVRRWRTLISVLVAAALAGCTGAGAAGPQPAVDYFDTLHEAWSTGPVDMVQYAAPDAVLDMRGYSYGWAAAGRGPIAQLLRDGLEAEATVIGDEPPYVSAHGAVDPSRILWDDVVLPQAPVYDLAARGFTRMLWSGSMRAGAFYISVERGPSDAIVDRYLAAWGRTDPADVDALYAPRATLSDSLLGVELAGVGAIAGAITADPDAGGLSAATLHEIPDADSAPADGGPAIYGIAPQREPGVVDPVQDALILLLEVPGEGDCPGSVGVVLDLDDQGLVTYEERYHRVDAVDRCIDLDGHDPWWANLTVPDPNAFSRTGTFTQGGQATELWNGTPEREQLLHWALTRYSDGLLPPPELSTVTFVPSSPDPWATYGFVPGTADLPLPASADSCPDAGCATWPTAARVEALTALAHVWLADTARTRPRDEYSATTGQEWFAAGSGSDRYPEPGPAAVRAAHTLAWGLMDQPYDLPDDIADLSCDELATDFLLLTDAPTAGQACAASG